MAPAIRTSSPAASSSGLPSPGHWRSSRRWSCWTSRSPHSTQPCAAVSVAALATPLRAAGADCRHPSDARPGGGALGSPTRSPCCATVRVAQVGAPTRLSPGRRSTQPWPQFLGDANLVSAQLFEGDAVTALGTLGTTLQASSRGVALVRPEQITLAGAGASGLPAEVVEQAYHGHDSILTVRPLRDCGSELLRVRVSGPERYPSGTRVVLAASGWSPSWPTPSEVILE